MTVISDVLPAGVLIEIQVVFRARVDAPFNLHHVNKITHHRREMKYGVTSATD